MTETPKCSRCGETRTHGAHHDSERCAIIARALAEYASGVMTEESRHIAELSRWLRDNPAPSTAMGRMARADRERGLEMWLKRLQSQEPSA